MSDFHDRQDFETVFKSKMMNKGNTETVEVIEVLPFVFFPQTFVTNLSVTSCSRNVARVQLSGKPWRDLQVFIVMNVKALCYFKSLHTKSIVLRELQKKMFN